MLTALIAVSLGLRLHLIFRLNFNWDEFRYLSVVHEYLRGDPVGMQQTLHVHLFSWLPSIAPHDEITQLTLARVVMFGIALVTTLLLFLFLKRLLSINAALFAVLCYASVADVLIHGASFRTDSLLTMLVVGASWSVVAHRKPPTWIAAGLLLALAAMITPKAIFFVPSIVALQWLAPTGDSGSGLRSRLRGLVGLTAVTILGWWIFRLLHGHLLGTAEETAREVTGLSSAASKVFGTGTLFPQPRFLVRSLEENLLVWILMTIGAGLALAGLRSTDVRHRTRSLQLLALALPVTTVAFYRNSFPYYYVPILALGVALCAATFERARRIETSSWLRSLLVWTLIAGVFGATLMHYGRNHRDHQEGQRRILAAVHRMFPQPVPYIDRCSMISSFPKVGFFMSTWGFENYLDGGQPVLTEAVSEHLPPLVVANIGALDLNVPESLARRAARRLTPEDARTLRDNYINHWGVLFVAGKSFELQAGGAQEFSILIPGTYTVEGRAAISIDGKDLMPGTTVRLERGVHTLVGPPGDRIVLRWGNHLHRPAEPPVLRPVFLGL